MRQHNWSGIRKDKKDAPVQRKVKKVASVRQASDRLVLDGHNKTEACNTDNTYCQLTIDAVCGTFCNSCKQYTDGLCYGCYEDCSADIRDCTTTECHKETTSQIIDPDGNLRLIKGPCAMRCCKRNNIKEWIERVSNGKNSLAIQNVNWNPFALPNLGQFIPCINDPVDGCEIPYVALPLSKIYSYRTDAIFNRDLYDIFRLHPKTKIIMTSYCQDQIIEQFWRSREIKKHFREIKKRGVDYSLAFNFSVYHGTPRMEHLINIKRNFELISEMQNEGINVIPDLGWHNAADLEQIVEWLNNNLVRHVSISFQLARENELMARNVEDTMFLVKHCPNVKKWIINGATTPRRIRQWVKRLPGMVLMNARSYQLAKYFMVWDFKCNDFVKGVKSNGEIISRSEALMKICQFYDDLVAGRNLDKFGDYFRSKRNRNTEAEI
jgi:hypothetical protein